MTYVVFRIVTAIGPVRHIPTAVRECGLSSVRGDFNLELSASRPRVMVNNGVYKQRQHNVQVQKNPGRGGELIALES